MEALMELERGVEEGLSRTELAKRFGVTTATITNRTKGIKHLEKALEGYSKVEMKDLSLLKVSVLEAVTPDKLENASLNDLTRAYKMFDDRRRLEEGKPTDIKGTLIAHIKAVDESVIKGEVVEGEIIPSPQKEEVEDYYDEEVF